MTHTATIPELQPMDGKDYMPNPMPRSSFQHGNPQEVPSKPKSRTHSRKELPPLFWYMEGGDWEKATHRATTHPRDVKTMATLRTGTDKSSVTKRYALHHACFKLRSASSTLPPNTDDDVFIQVCKFVLLLISLYPEAAGKRESKHGCLPLHLAAFVSGVPRPAGSPSSGDDDISENGHHRRASSAISATLSNLTMSSPNSPKPTCSNKPSRPFPLSSRSSSETTADTTHTTHTNMTAVFEQEQYTGDQTHFNNMFHVTPNIMDETEFNENNSSAGESASSVSVPSTTQQSVKTVVHTVNPIIINSKREEWMVRVINALLDAFPKAVKMDSEGGRLPLHVACAGKAPPRVISTLVTANPAAARDRNKDGFLPLHLAAHWGVSHPNVAVTLLKAYPDATVGRNRWERTPLEEALCMAGENGRPYQAPLVRALRKHPTYWERPPQELFENMRREAEGAGPRMVDMDATIPSTGSSEEEEGRRYFNGGYTHFLEDEEIAEVPYETSEANGGALMKRLSPRNLLHRKGGRERSMQDIGMDLPTLIKNLKWKAAVERLECNPDEAGLELHLMTRGGFLANSGMLPLHYACERRPPIEVVQALIEAFPEAVSTRMMPAGCLPLHIACTWHASPLVVNALCQADTTTARTVDELGNRPLHAACFSGAAEGVIQAVLSAYPKAVLSTNNQGSQPLDITSRLRHYNKQAVIQILEEKKKKLLGKINLRNSSSGSHSGDAARAMDMNQRYVVDGPPLLEMGNAGMPRHSIDERRAVPGLGVEITYQDNKDGSQQALLWI